MKTNPCPPLFAAILLPLFPAVSNALPRALIDFGMNGTTPAGHPDRRTTVSGTSWNNLAVGNASGAAVDVPTAFASLSIADNGGLPDVTSYTLLDTTGASTGWSISFQGRRQSTAGQVGTAGTGGDYAGTNVVSPAAAALFPANASSDGLYVNNSGILRVTLSGLQDGAVYDLLAFTGRGVAGTSSTSSWNLVTGTAVSARFQDSTGAYTTNTGTNTINATGANNGRAVDWTGVSPSEGKIVFDIITSTSLSNNATALNALALTQTSSPPPEVVDVYLLGGQSNMQGLGKLSELSPAQLAAPADVFYWTGSSFVPLVPGTTVTAAAGEFGPEIAFATEVAKRGRKAYLVKTYNSDKPLDSGWNDQTWVGDPPAPGRVNFHPGLTSVDPNKGTLYQNQLLPACQNALAAITTSGKTPVVRGLVWMQGEQDSKNLTSATRYAENLKLLRDRLAADLGLTPPTSLPLVFGQVLPFEPAEARFTHRAQIRADMALADQDSGSPKVIPLCRMVSTDGYPVYPSPDAVHYTTAGQLTLGKAFATHLAALTAKSTRVSFHLNSTGTLAAMDPATAPLTQGTVVDTAASTWNNVGGSAALTLTATPIKASDNVNYGTQVSGSVGFVGSAANGWAGKNKDSVMMDGWFGIYAGESISVTNLPGDVAQGFHVIIHGDSNDSNRTMGYTIGGTSRTIIDSGTFNGTFTEGSNYVVFPGLSGKSFTLTGNPAGARSAVNAISIIPGDPLMVESFTSTRRYIQSGGESNLSWSVSNADSVTISPSVGTVAASGSVVLHPSATTTYTLTARRGDMTVSRSVTVTVGPPRPNIVVFMVDDMGWQDTSVPFQYDASGNPVVTGFNQRYRTPNMETLAASGVKFTNAHSAAVCSPSRVSLMTGQSPARHRVTQWTLSPNTDQSGVSATLKSPLDWNVNGIAPATDTVTPRTWRTADTLPRVLHNAGYRTIHVGKAHFAADGTPGEDPLAQGFDVNIAGHAAGGPGSYLGTENYGTGIYQVPGLEAYHGTDTFLTEAVTLEANKAVQKSVEDGQPFYLYMAHYAIHVPLYSDPRFAANYPGLDETERRYASMIEGMDKSLGDIRAKLQQLGVAENTLILFYSDNGGLSAAARGTTPSGTGTNTHNKPLRAGKGSAYEGGTRVPALAAWATADPANPFQQGLTIVPSSRCDKPLIVEDLYPTLLGVAKVPVPGPVDGVDVAPYLRGDPAFKRPQPMLFHYPHIWTAGYIGMNQGYEMHSSLTDGDWKVIHYYEGNRWELYNLDADLGEANNLASTRPELVLKYGRAMMRLLAERGAVYPANRTTNAAQPPLLPVYASVDSDSDGLTDAEEDVNHNGLVDPGETDPDNADADHDGSPDGIEVRLGLDPFDATSRFEMSFTPAPAAPGELELTWTSLPGVLFTIRSSPDLIDWSTIEAEHVPAAPEPARKTTRTIVPQDPRRFYRIIVE